MARVLITDVDSPVGFELVKLHLNAGDRVLTTTRDARATSRFPDNEGESLLTVHWSGRSPLASRNVILSALNFMEGLDRCCILQAPQIGRALVHEVQAFDIEAAVDIWIKGYVFLIKHVLRYHLESSAPQGAVALLVDERDDPEAAEPPLSQMVQSAFSGLARGVLDSYSVAGLELSGFRWQSGRPADFAAFVCRTLDAPGGGKEGARWHRFGRLPLLAGIARQRAARRG